VRTLRQKAGPLVAEARGFQVQPIKVPQGGPAQQLAEAGPEMTADPVDPEHADLRQPGRLAQAACPLRRQAVQAKLLARRSRPDLRRVLLERRPLVRLDRREAAPECPPAYPRKPRHLAQPPVAVSQLQGLVPLAVRVVAPAARSALAEELHLQPDEL